MSDSPVAIRAIALAEALKYAAIHKVDGIATIISVAGAFADFLGAVPANNAAEAPPKSGKSATAEKPAKSVTVDKSIKVKPDPVVDTDDEGADVPTKADIGVVVEKLLAADKRDEAVALMKKFKAASVSTLKESDYAAFIAGAEAILMTA